MMAEDFHCFLDKVDAYNAYMQDWKRKGDERPLMCNQIGPGRLHMVLSYNPIQGETYEIRTTMDLSKKSAYAWTIFLRTEALKKKKKVGDPTPASIRKNM